MKQLQWNEDFIQKVGKTAFKKLTSKKVGSGAPNELLEKLVEASATVPPPKKIDDDYMNLTLDPQFSSRIFKAYFNAIEKVVYLIHSPTDVKEMEDIVSDVLLAISIHSTRVKAAIKQHLKAEEKYTKLDYKITIIGYSLGAYVASRVKDSDKIVDRILISQPIVPHILREKVDDKTYRIRSVKDAVSLLYPVAAKGKNDVNLKAESNNIFKEHQASVILKRIPKNKMVGIDLKGGGSKLKFEIDEFKKQTPKNRKNKKIKSSPILNKMEVEEVFEEKCEELEGAGKPQKKSKGPSVKELKAELKSLRYQKRAKVVDYPVSGRKKQELIDSIAQLRAM